MNNQQLLTKARNAFFEIKKEDSININPCASFANQFIGLLNRGTVTSRESISRLTRLYYPRRRMTLQWRLFGRVVEKHLRTGSGLNKQELLLFFGYLKRLLTIEGKNENSYRRSHDRKNQRNKRHGYCKQ